MGPNQVVPRPLRHVNTDIVATRVLNSQNSLNTRALHIEWKVLSMHQHSKKKGRTQEITLGIRSLNMNMNILYCHLHLKNGVAESDQRQGSPSGVGPSPDLSAPAVPQPQPRSGYSSTCQLEEISRFRPSSPRKASDSDPLQACPARALLPSVVYSTRKRQSRSRLHAASENASCEKQSSHISIIAVRDKI
ncbi:uncharacterized protein LOC122541363 isoform X2 [Chiloscyllium plagiosum]|uniref:uncharacterized protein LOC122541363 isoform X2 n=1 Tax=Chiloscyllium plagiosum TaxID=36176 RepID=UPI001CB80E14|nr:uncharacterized protein LOC122541363 isoform X2 [Chiloscyllium plagiosum]